MAKSRYRWTGKQCACLDTLWWNESNWKNTADNPHSTAYGIAQFMAFTWKYFGPKTSNATLQIKYGLQYIKQRYGTPCKALYKWRSRCGGKNGCWY